MSFAVPPLRKLPLFLVREWVHLTINRKVGIHVYFLSFLTGQLKMEGKREILVALASKHNTVPYDILMSALNIANEREFEDFIIESIYQDIIQGRLNPVKRYLEIHDWRNESAGDFQFMANTLNQWDKHCGNFLGSIGAEMKRANDKVAQITSNERAVSEEAENIRKTFSFDIPKKFLGDGEFPRTSSKPEAKKFKGMRNKKPGN